MNKGDPFTLYHPNHDGRCQDQHLAAAQVRGGVLWGDSALQLASKPRLDRVRHDALLGL